MVQTKLQNKIDDYTDDFLLSEMYQIFRPLGRDGIQRFLDLFDVLITNLGDSSCPIEELRWDLLAESDRAFMRDILLDQPVWDGYRSLVNAKRRADIINQVRTQLFGGVI